ncbi:MAG: DUF4157 domain-containing protein [Deltaproteobacteria bacterium]|nr:DUF4157 domain-containing protein [Deltaproteobacteria bacterium]
MSERDSRRRRGKYGAASHAQTAKPIAPGKQTLTQGLHAPDPAHLFELGFKKAAAQVPLLLAAIAERDFDRVLVPMFAAKRWLASMRETQGTACDGARRLAELEQILSPLIAQAPQITNDTFHDYYSGDHRAWNAERDRWLGGIDREQAALSTAESSPGTGLPSPIRAQLESRAGIDLSGVRVHTGAESQAAAEAVGAQAYAVGQNIHFGTGNYDPSSSSGQHLIAHEVAHTIQQRGASPRPLYKLAVTTPGDPAEVEADRFADAVIRGGESVAISSHEASIARDTKPASSAPAPAAPQLQLPDGVNFSIDPDGWSVKIRTSWLSSSPVERLTEVLQQMQRLGAFTWAKPADLRRAAEKTRPVAASAVVEYEITVRTLAQMGLPPLAGTMVAHEGDNLVVAIRVPGVKDDGEKHLVGPSDLTMVEGAVENFTGLKVVQHVRFEGEAVRDGILEIRVTDADATKMFGDKAWKGWKSGRAEGKGGGAANNLTTSDLSFAERVRVETWLKDNLAIVDVGGITRIDRVLMNVIDEIDANPKLKAIIQQHVGKRMTKPGQVIGALDLKEILEAARSEADRQRLGLDGKSDATLADPSMRAWSIHGKIVQKGLVFAEREMDFVIELDWDLWKTGRSAAEQHEFAKRDWHAEVEWAVERQDKPGKVVKARKNHDSSKHMSLSHTFHLDKGEKNGVYLVHAFMRSSHFVPLHFTAPIEVKTEDARMAELREAAMGDMTGADTTMMNTRFDVGTAQKVLDHTPIGKHDDTHGYTISGALPKGFRHTDQAQRSKNRNEELEIQKKLAAYLRKQAESGSPGYGDAVLAAERRVTFLEATEKKLATDAANGWKPFELRGTYLSKGPDVPSGGLELYGFYQTTYINETLTFWVTVRDLSNKIESDLEFRGDGRHFDDALREAFVKLAKAYPSGKVSVLAEDLTVDKAMHVIPNGRSIGYELATTSAWKRVKSTVYDPAVQILTNAAAMAVMVAFPPSAAVLVPTLAVLDIVHNVDDLVAKYEKNKLTWGTAKINLLQIGLDVLPAARGAKVLNPAKSAVQEASGMVNLRLVAFEGLQFGGQVLVMFEATREQLVQIQEKQISVMAAKFAALIELEKEGRNPSDPTIAHRRAEIEQDAKAMRDTVMTTWATAVAHQATFFVGSHLLGGHAEAAKGHEANRETHIAEAPKAVKAMKRLDEHTYETHATDIRSVHTHYQTEAVETSPLRYDPAKGKASFEITHHGGAKQRIEAPMRRVSSFGELHASKNTVVGHPVDTAAGLVLIEKLNRGDASALATVGIKDAAGGVLPHKVEFGLGELGDGRVVLVIGEFTAVDWSHLPGMKPRAHTHPPAVHEIPDQGMGKDRVQLAKLVEPTPIAFIPREVVFPSGADIIMMAHQAIDGHVVVTGFVVRGGIVMKAPPGDNSPRLLFTIVHAEHVGAMPDGTNIYKARVVGKSGSETLINHDVWVKADKADTNGSLFMERPAGAVIHEPGLGKRAEPSSKTEARQGVPKAPLTPTDAKRKQALMKEWEGRGLDELRELVALRERGGETTYAANTPEHKLSSWKETESEKAFDKWSPIYHRNMTNALGGLAREGDLRAALDNGNGLVASRRFSTPRGDRQVDAWIPGEKEVCLQLKSGDADLTREQHGGQLPNYEAILRDRALLREGKVVVWVVEGRASQPLRDMLAGTTRPAGPVIVLIEGAGAFARAVKLYGLPPKKGQ